MLKTINSREWRDAIFTIYVLANFIGLDLLPENENLQFEIELQKYGKNIPSFKFEFVNLGGVITIFGPRICPVSLHFISWHCYFRVTRHCELKLKIDVW